MNREADLLYEDQAPRDRISILSEASVHNNESLAVIVVQQKVTGNARSLISARYGVISSMDESTRGGLESPFGSKDARDHIDPSQISKTVPSTVPFGPPVRS